MTIRTVEYTNESLLLYSAIKYANTCIYLFSRWKRDDAFMYSVGGKERMVGFSWYMFMMELCHCYFTGYKEQQEFEF